MLWLLPAAGVPVLKPYQTARLTGFTNPDSDPGGLTYNVTQSRTAVGAGGLSGRGVEGASQTRLDYLPEHATDFVFASFAEQRGFVGTSILLLLYLLVVWRGLRVITVAGDLYGAVVAGGIVFAFLFEVFVNVGMTMGIAPVTGIPLPFVTVGGSSMVANLLAVGVLQAIHARGRAERSPLSAVRHRDRAGRSGSCATSAGSRARRRRSPSRGPAPRSLPQRSSPGASLGRRPSTAILSGLPSRFGSSKASRPLPRQRFSVGSLRAGTPLLVVRRGAGRIPYVLPGDVLDAGRGPAGRRSGGGDRPGGAPTPLPPLPPACRFSVLRSRARLIRTTSLRQRGARGFALGCSGPHLPLLSLAQSRMLLLLGLARGNVLPRDPQELAVAAGPAVAGSVGLGLGARALVRRLPVQGPARPGRRRVRRHPRARRGSPAPLTS